MTRFTLDSNVLVYAADGRDPVRRMSAIGIIEAAVPLDCVLLPQCLSEFFYSVVRKRILPAYEAMAQVEDWLALFTMTGGPSAASATTAMHASVQGRFQFFDALLLAGAAEAGCSAIISENLEHGSELNGVRVVSAFDGNGGISGETWALVG